MALNTSTFSNYIETLISTGADAYSNLYEIVFTKPTVEADDDIWTSFSVRCDQFTPPAISHGTYPVRYVTAYIDRPNAKVDVTRNFSLTFRVDSNYQAYKKLLMEMKNNHNYESMYTATDIMSDDAQNRLFSVEVKVLTKPVASGTNADTAMSSDNVETLYKFTGCWLSHVTNMNYKTDSSSPITVTATVNFLRMEDWQTGVSDKRTPSTL